MLITYMRSSSYSNFDFCQMQYYINYVLGIQRGTSPKAAKGTATHKVLELLANMKLQFQKEQTGWIDFKDKELGKLGTIYLTKFLNPYTLSQTEVDEINRTRINKQTYKTECSVPYGHIRYGVELVEELIAKVCKHYDNGWAPVDHRDITNWVWMTLDYNNGAFDPRRRNIVAAEPHFNFGIDREWAKYNWTLANGEEISGKLEIKGTIDLITQVGDGILEIVDWKSGQRLDWTSRFDNDVKTYAKLQKDFQLMLYYYAARKLYPDVKQIIVTIFFIRDGGPFTMCYDEHTLAETEDRLRDRFNEIGQCIRPTMQDPTQCNFKCKFICDYFKTVSPDNKTNLCRFIHDKIHEVGIDEVTKAYTNSRFNIGHYEAPGEV